MLNTVYGSRKGLARIFEEPHDGTVRTMLVHAEEKDGGALSLAASLVRSVGGELPVATRLPLHSRGWPESGALPFAVYPAHTVEYLPDGWFKGRMVLIGADLPLQDRHRTPLSVGVRGDADMAGVLIHAHALSQLPGGSQPRALSWYVEFCVYMFFGILGVVLVRLPSSNLVRGSVGLAVVVLCWASAVLLFNRTGTMIPLVMPTVTLVLSAGAVTAWMWRQEQVQRRFINAAFHKYLSPVVIDKLIENPDELRLSGEKREMTFLFTDLAGFTALSERTDPEALVTLLNRYLEGICDIAIQYNGTIDKVVGDALHVIFNAPRDQVDHPERAVGCALALDQFCQSYRAEKHKQGMDLGVTRIGINTGRATVGNFGGKNRFDYTAYGDPINVAARLENVNKFFGTRICVSQATVDQVKNMLFRPVGDLVLKGKTEAIGVYEPYDPATRDKTQFQQYLKAYELLKLKHPDARTVFEELTRLYPSDSLIAFHSRRLDGGKVGHQILMEQK